MDESPQPGCARTIPQLAFKIVLKLTNNIYIQSHGFQTDFIFNC